MGGAGEALGDSSPLMALTLHGDVSDAIFDSLYSSSIAKLSELFWTPVAVAKQAAGFLAPMAGTKVLDVGSGVGKFSLVGACTTSGHFHGVEQRSDLVEIARSLARPLNIAPTFQIGNALELDWSEYQGIYLYNPFFELASGPWCQIDDTLSHSREIQQRYIDATTRHLERAHKGTRVATYYGFGGPMPEGYRLIAKENSYKGPLEMWVRD